MLVWVFLFHRCLHEQVSYFEIYMDKIRDLLDGQLTAHIQLHLSVICVVQESISTYFNQQLTLYDYLCS